MAGSVDGKCKFDFVDRDLQKILVAQDGKQMRRLSANEQTIFTRLTPV